MKIFWILIFFTTSLFANTDQIFRDQFKNCQGSNVSTLHARANKMIQKTVKAITEKGIYNPEIDYALKDYFDLDVFDKADTYKIKRVISNLKRVAANSNSTNYTCHQKGRGLWCLKRSVIAIVPPPKNIVYLCPSFFKKTNKMVMIGTILHEWFHRWGGSHIDYLPETYCHENKYISSSVLIRSSDQYAMFIMSIATKTLNYLCPGQKAEWRSTKG